MIKLEARAEPSRAMSIASPAIALAITVVVGTILFALLGKDPLRGLEVFLRRAAGRAPTRCPSWR